jgi:hypothetical protein
MHRTTALARPALVAAAAAVLLTACSGSDGGPSDATATSGGATSSSSTSPSSAAPSSTAPSSTTTSTAPSGGADAAQFCSEVGALAPLVGQLSAATPTEVPGILRQAVDALQGIEPPAEVADAYRTVNDSLSEASRLADSLDLSTQEGQQQFSTQAGQVLAQAGPASTELETWTGANCPTPAPTS